MLSAYSNFTNDNAAMQYEKENTGWFKKTFTFLGAIFLQIPILFSQTLLISVKNIVSSIFPENGIENNHIVFNLQLFEKVQKNHLCPRVNQRTQGSKINVDLTFR